VPVKSSMRTFLVKEVAYCLASIVKDSLVKSSYFATRVYVPYEFG